MRWLERIVPFRLALLAIVILVATGFLLREVPRFQSAVWGLTEMTHIAVGWSFLGIFLLYLTHHLRRHWGDLRTIQRLLGLALALSTTHLLLTGALLAVGRPGGFPDLVRDSHHLMTYAFCLLLVVHGTVGLRRRLGSFLRGLRRSEGRS